MNHVVCFLLEAGDIFHLNIEKNYKKEGRACTPKIRLCHMTMKMYAVPPNMNEKEKVIGGILNINQFFWILGGFAISAIVFALAFQLGLRTGALIVAFPFLLTGTPFAFYKKKELTLFRYFHLKKQFKNKVKKLPNMKKEVTF